MSQQITENGPGSGNTADKPFFSIIIPTYNSAATLDALLSSLENQTYTRYEVIVVDDKSTDDTAVVVKKHPAAQYVCMDSNQGPAAARNRGATLAKGEWLVFTDADTEFLPDSVEHICDALNASDADAMFGTYSRVPANRGFMPRYKALWDFWCIDLSLSLDENGMAPHMTWAPRPGVVRRIAFEGIGGFDTSFTGADLEDMDLGYRLHQAGYRLYFASKARIKHHYPATLWREIRPFARRSALWIRMRASHPSLDASGEGSPRQALGHLTGFVSFWTILGAILFGAAWGYITALVLIGSYTALNYGFVRLCMQEESLLFALRALAVLWLHSIVLGFSAGYGLLQAMLRRH